MAAAPLRYTADGQVDWGTMWESFCALALDGGPPHRGALLRPDEGSDPASPAYQAAATEIARGVAEVSGLPAAAAAPGWVAVRCASPAMARWLSEAITAERVVARHEGALLFVPVGEGYTLKGEIKSVVTAVAKTSHYWREHLPASARAALEAQERLNELWHSIRERFVG
jgi:sirohydrochlorin cobaltochelatase